MKKLAITLSLLAGATFGYAQGTLNWSDYQSATAASGGSPALPAFTIEVFAPGTETGSGNTGADLPAGTATYSGAPLSGTGYDIGLYVGATASAAQNALGGAPSAIDTFSSGFAGRWDVSENLVAATSVASGAVFVELAAWANSGASGAATTYAAAVADGYAAGVSGVSSGTTTLGGALQTPGTLAGIGLQSFELSPTVVPEPSTIALGVIGASTFLMRLRRKQ